jgi:hypothetical protein
MRSLWGLLTRHPVPVLATGIVIILTAVAGWNAIFKSDPRQYFLGTTSKGQPVFAVGVVILGGFVLWLELALLWQYFKEKRQRSLNESAPKRKKAQRRTR